MNKLGRIAIVALAAAVAPVVQAQNGAAPHAPAAEISSSHPAMFAEFPRPRADLPFLDSANAWPKRWNNSEQRRGVVIEVDNPAEFPAGYRAPDFRPLARNASELRALKGDAPLPESLDVLTAGRGSFMYIVREADAEKPVPRSRRNTADAMLKFVSAQEEDLDSGPALVIEQTWFAVYQPKVQPRGLALVSPGLLGTPPGTLQNVSELLRKDGWLVLRMLSQPSRFTEQLEFKLDGAADIDAQAKAIAKITGNRTAECAYAVQAAAAHLESAHPGLKTQPRVAVGFSGGAMTLPTIIAREPERYAAAVLVGGGADFWLMNQRSNYRELIKAVKETWAEKPSPETLAALDEAYLKNAPLDSYHTAAVLKGKPVLMIQGTADRAVPAPLGDLLWERLGRPERWLDEGASHESLFMNLPRDHFPRMMEWLNRAAPRLAQDAPAAQPE
ncbi:MAG TPA: alpha/beta hydrolase [Phycisphaerales bacterium]|nr:alpha/beta hydrolase [Phycisphaerales bacterium]